MHLISPTLLKMATKYVKISVLLCVFITLLYLSPVDFVSATTVNTNVQAVNAGVQLRLMKNGVTYLNKVISEIINEVTPNAEMPDIDQTFKGGAGSFRMFNLHIVNFKVADKYAMDLKAPNKITWTATNMNIGLKGDIDAQYGGQFAMGDFDSLANGVNVAVTLALTKLSNGQLGINATDCKSSAKDFDFDIHNMGPVEAMFSIYKEMIVGFLKPRILNEMCDEIKSIVVDVINITLENVGPKVTLQNSTTTNDKDREMDTFRNQTFVDYSLLKDPNVISSPYVDMFHKGEISYQGKGGTPLSPSAMNNAATSNRMIVLSVDDYLYNTMLYHAYQQRALNGNYNRSNAHDSSDWFKSSQCTNCVGSVFPEIAISYQDNQIELTIRPKEPPTVVISSGKVKLQSKGSVILVAKKGQSSKNLLTCEYSITDGNVQQILENNFLKSIILMKNINVKVTSFSLTGVNQKQIDELSKIVQSLLADKFNRLFENGIPMPITNFTKVVNPTTSLLDGYIKFDADIEIDKKTFTKKIRNRITERYDG